MFLAIINDTYSEVKSENASTDIHIGSYLRGKCNQMVEYLVKALPFLHKKRTKSREKRREDDDFDDEMCNSSSEIKNS